MLYFHLMVVKRFMTEQELIIREMEAMTVSFPNSRSLSMQEMAKITTCVVHLPILIPILLKIYLQWQTLDLRNFLWSLL